MDSKKKNERYQHSDIPSSTTSSSPGFSLPIILTIILSLLDSVTQANSCQVHLCSAEYEAALMAGQRLHRSALRELRPRISQATAYCGYLTIYSQCMGSISKSCRGNLYYHAVITQVRRRIEENDCGVPQPPSPSAETTTPTTPVKPHQREQEMTSSPADQVIRRRKKPEQTRRIHLHCNSDDAPSSSLTSSQCMLRRGSLTIWISVITTITFFVSYINSLNSCR